MNHTLTSPSSSATSCSPPRSSIATSSTSFDGKRLPRLKESQFANKHGRKLHSYDPEKAPYPLSYDRHVLELESLDNRLTKFLRNGSVSFVKFSESELPERCLDLGCGTGTWIIDAAKEWPKCEFVGFDLVNVQIPLKMLEPSISERIQWVHGNFLTTKLPFEEDEFDHVHIQHIARGVPETKWAMLFEEIHRVIRPGGSIEIIEDNIIFPTLPRWFTAPLRARPRRATSVHLPDGTQRGYPEPHDTSANPGHDHALLESLHASVYDHRFINMKPSALLPSYFTTYFRHVTLGPVLSFPMPSIPPLQPLPPQMAATYALPLGLDTDTRASMVTTSPANGTRPVSLSFSSIISDSTVSSSSEKSRKQSISFSFVNEVAKALPAGHVIHNAGSETESSPHDPLPPTQPQQLYMVDNLVTDENGAIPSGLVQMDKLQTLNERSLAMHLYRSYQSVLACQEAIWEELKDRLRNRKDELEPYGWEDDEEFEEPQNRKKFERLLERYQKDMFQRVSLWNSLLDMGWMLPPREPLSRAELIEEERMREAMLEARKSACSEDLQSPCRSVRVLIGFKP